MQYDLYLSLLDFRMKSLHSLKLDPFSPSFPQQHEVNRVQAVTTGLRSRSITGYPVIVININGDDYEVARHKVTPTAGLQVAATLQMLQSVIATSDPRALNQDQYFLFYDATSEGDFKRIAFRGTGKPRNPLNLAQAQSLSVDTLPEPQRRLSPTKPRQAKRNADTMDIKEGSDEEVAILPRKKVPKVEADELDQGHGDEESDDEGDNAFGEDGSPFDTIRRSHWGISPEGNLLVIIQTTSLPYDLSCWSRNWCGKKVIADLQSHEFQHKHGKFFTPMRYEVFLRNPGRKACFCRN